MSEFLGHTELQGDVVFNLTFTQNKKIPSRKECEVVCYDGVSCSLAQNWDNL